MKNKTTKKIKYPYDNQLFLEWLKKFQSTESIKSIEFISAAPEVSGISFYKLKAGERIFFLYEVENYIKDLESETRSMQKYFGKNIKLLKVIEPIALVDIPYEWIELSKYVSVYSEPGYLNYIFLIEVIN